MPISKILIETNTEYIARKYFPDEETRQKVTISGTGEVAVGRFAHSGQLIDFRTRYITRSAADDILYELLHYIMTREKKSVIDLGTWEVMLWESSGKLRKGSGPLLYGSSAREMELSDRIRELVDIRGMYILDGVPYHRTMPKRVPVIHRAAWKWIQLIENSDSWFVMVQEHLDRELEQLGFEVEFGKWLENIYHPEGNIAETEVLRRLLPDIHNPEILGAVIRTQLYRYRNQAEEPETRFEESGEWLQAALTTLYNLTFPMEE